MAKILVVDDDEHVQNAIADALRRAGHDASCALNGTEATRRMQSSRFDLAIVDLRLPGSDGIATFRLLRREQPGLLGILITRFREYPDDVVAPMRAGFSHYIGRSFQPAELVRQVEGTIMKGVASGADRVEGVTTRADDMFEDMVGGVPQMRDVFDLIVKVAATDEPVLILGETGTGKELVARAIHRRSPRSSRHLHVLNCGATGPDSLLESELFGHERGAFTGAIGRAVGWFEHAQGGTLFFDEVGELSAAAQAKLLRAIEHREIYRLGGHQAINVDVRIIAATNVNLRGTDVWFRKDLFHRLSALEIALPPLRERLADLPYLVSRFLPSIGAALHRPIPTLSDDAMRILQAYSWPGNVRELQQELKKACLRSSGSVLAAEHFSDYLNSPSKHDLKDQPQAEFLSERIRAAARDLRRTWIEEALARTGGNVSAAADLLGVNRRTIQRLTARK